MVPATGRVPRTEDARMTERSRLSALPHCEFCAVVDGTGPHDNWCPNKVNAKPTAPDIQQQERIETLTKALHAAERALLSARREEDRLRRELTQSEARAVALKAEVARLRQQGTELALAKVWGAELSSTLDRTLRAVLAAHLSDGAR